MRLIADCKDYHLTPSNLSRGILKVIGSPMPFSKLVYLKNNNVQNVKQKNRATFRRSSYMPLKVTKIKFNQGMHKYYGWPDH